MCKLHNPPLVHILCLGLLLTSVCSVFGRPEGNMTSAAWLFNFGAVYSTEFNSEGSESGFKVTLYYQIQVTDDLCT